MSTAAAPSHGWTDGLTGWLASLAAGDVRMAAAVRRAVLDWPADAVQAVAALSHLGDRWVIGLLVAGACAGLAWRGQSLRAAAMAGLMGAQGLLVWGFKALTERARPAGGAIDPAWVVVNGSSLPSGHASAALVGLGLLAWLALRSGRLRSRGQRGVVVGVAAALAAGVGVSRVLLGVHYPIDVLAGWCLGGLWLAWSIRLLDALPAAAPGAAGPAAP